MKLTEMKYQIIRATIKFDNGRNIADKYANVICDIHLKVLDTLQVKLSDIERKMTQIQLLLSIKNEDSKFYIDTTDVKQYGKRLSKVLPLFISKYLNVNISKRQRDIIKNIVTTDWEIDVISKNIYTYVFNYESLAGLSKEEVEQKIIRRDLGSHSSCYQDLKRNVLQVLSDGTPGGSFGYIKIEKYEGLDSQPKDSGRCLVYIKDNGNFVIFNFYSRLSSIYGRTVADMIGDIVKKKVANVYLYVKDIITNNLEYDILEGKSLLFINSDSGYYFYDKPDEVIENTRFIIKYDVSYYISCVCEKCGDININEDSISENLEDANVDYEYYKITDNNNYLCYNCLTNLSREGMLKDAIDKLKRGEKL